MILESTFRAHDHASKSGELLFIAHEYDSGIYFLFSFWAHDHGGLIVNRAQGSFYPSSGCADTLLSPITQSVHTQERQAASCANSIKVKRRIETPESNGG